MRRSVPILVLAAALAVLLSAASARADFGFKELALSFSKSDKSPETQAGSHPFGVTTTLDVNTKLDPESGQQVPDDYFRDLVVNLPPGLVGTPNPVPFCSSADFLHVVGESQPACSDESVIGIAAVGASLSPGPGVIYAPVYNLKSRPGVAAKFGLIVFSVPVTVEATVNPDPPYNLIAHVTNISQIALFYGSRLTLWGNPASPAHDALRGHCVDSLGGTPTEPASRGLCPVAIPEKPFLTVPRSCRGTLMTLFQADAWLTAAHVEGIATSPEMTDCEDLGFDAEIDAVPTTDRAESPTGLDFNLDIEDEGLTDPAKRAQSDIEKAVVTLPEGVTVNPSVATGLATCAPSDYNRETLTSEPGDGCPEASKVGNVEVETPLLENEVLKGTVFVAQQDDPATSEPGAENPFDSLLALYMVIRHPQRGILAKLPGRVEPDPATGQLTTTFDDLPQFPFAHLRFHFRGGERSPLATPPACGTYKTQARFTPWANPGETVPFSSSFEIASGAGGGPCPAGGVRPFHPGFLAGSMNNKAGSYSPFYMRMTRGDGEQDLTKFSTVLPPGVLARIAGVAKCSDAAIAAARGRTGRAELASPSCPAGSEIGRVLAGAGVGSQLTYVPGKIYLAGPLGGDPLSVVAIVPAVAGPFDVGTVVTRVALSLDRSTGEVHVDGSKSDPIPRIIKGIPLKVRDIQVFADRPDFTITPTSCAPLATSATLFGSNVNLFDPADDLPAQLSSRYQAASCLSLGYKPSLALTLKGGTRRSDNPALRATFRPRPGDANTEDIVVRLPHAAFLDQSHINTICTRVQFAADACPQGARYGYARAWTPLLEEPLQGPVYLRSSNHPLPDMVFDLKGLVDIEVTGRIDSANGGIRTTFTNLPDAPISKVVLSMQGGKKGLIVNSRNLCVAKSRVNADFAAHNGRALSSRPLLKPSCPRQRKKK